ncbi:MAG: AarF/ABC1/UbiB kinase family protein [Bdellovibrionota bacterium]
MASEKKEKLNKNEIDKIKSSTLSRGLSVLGMTVATGAKYVSYKFGEAFSNREEKNPRLHNFLSEQANFLVKEFGKLKGSFMKVGQMLSTYGEYYLPPEVNGILKRLQAESAPVSWNTMRRVIEKNLGAEIYEQLDICDEPISAASMGQVYRAVRRSDGKVLALKVQYPGVDKAIDNDLKAIKSILTLSKLVPIGPEFNEIFNEVRMMLRNETDYGRELEQIKTFQNLLADDPRFIIPEVFPEYSTKRILCMSFEEGVSMHDGRLLELSQLRRNKLGVAIMDLMFKEMFIWRMVQTDCHFGNFKIKIDEGVDGEDIDRIVLFDFGAIRKFPKRYMEPFAKLVYAALHRDAEGIVQLGVKLGFLRETDSQTQLDLFVDLCYAAIIPFDECYASPSLDGADSGDNPYLWGKTDLINALSNMARDAVFAFKFRAPPRETVFLNRKMVGTYFFLRKINFEFGPRKLLLSHLQEDKTSGS